MDIFLYKGFDGNFIPADDEDREKAKKIKNGTIVKAKVTVPRNYKYHQKFFVFIKATFDMQEHFEDMEVYRKWITMKAGWFDTIHSPNGNTVFAAKSISFDSMEEDEFEKLFSACIDVFLKELGNGITEDELRRVVEFS